MEVEGAAGRPAQPVVGSPDLLPQPSDVEP